MKPFSRSFPTILFLTFGAPTWAQDAVRINPTDPQPTCTMCPGTYIPVAELEGYARKALAEKLVDQQVRLFDASVADNIAYGLEPRLSREAIAEAAKLAHAWEFIERLPLGLDEPVGQNGGRLSKNKRKQFPDLTAEDIQACLQYAKALVAAEEIDLNSVPA